MRSRPSTRPHPAESPKSTGARRLGDRPLSDVTRYEIATFRDGLLAELAPKTTNNNLKGVRMIFRAARRDGIIDLDPCEFLETARIPHDRPRRRAFSLDEIRSVLSVADPRVAVTATTILHDAGVAAAVAQEFIGHESEEIHRVYVRTGREALKRVAQAMPSLL